jgi:hypothetical protein
VIDVMKACTALAMAIMTTVILLWMIMTMIMVMWGMLLTVKWLLILVATVVISFAEVTVITT